MQQYGQYNLIDINDSVLVIIDIQVRLVSAMPSDIVNTTIEQAQRLTVAATTLKIPVLLTEQYPRGLGVTVSQLTEKMDGVVAIEKTSFSCAKVASFMQQLEQTGRKQVVLSGMESHICILQTALELQEKGYQVFIAEDGVCSRTQQNKLNALQRMQQAGITITNMESVLFEWLGDASHPDFKVLSKLIV